MGKVEMIVDSYAMRNVIEYVQLKLTEKPNAVIFESIQTVHKAYLKATPIKILEE